MASLDPPGPSLSGQLETCHFKRHSPFERGWFPSIFNGPAAVASLPPCGLTRESFSATEHHALACQCLIAAGRLSRLPKSFRLPRQRPGHRGRRQMADCTLQREEEGFWSEKGKEAGDGEDGWGDTVMGTETQLHLYVALAVSSSTRLFSATPSSEHSGSAR